MTPKSVYAIEVSGVCNLESHCSWCPMYSKPRNRARGLMGLETVTKCMDWIDKIGSSSPLALHNFGEPLIHPEFDSIALNFSRVAPITVSTNAVLLDERWADRLAKIKWEWISISTWKRDAVDRAVRLLNERDIPFKVPPGVTHNWAGQSEGPSTKLFKGCHFLDEGKATIRWNGDVTTCCITDRVEDVKGTVMQAPSEVVLDENVGLCKGCHHAT